MEWYKMLKSTCATLVAVLLLGLLTGCATNLEKNRKEGLRLYNAQQYDQSLAAFKSALRDSQYDAVSNAYAGLIEYRADHLEQAEYHLRLALIADPSSEEAKAGLTSTLIKKGKPDDALDALERAARMAENVDDPRWEKSLKRPYTKQVDERLYTGKINDRIRIAKTYETLLGDYDNALTYYKKALELKPGDATAAGIYLSMATMAERAKNGPVAREYLAEAYRRDPALPGLTDAMTRNNLAISDVLANPK